MLGIIISCFPNPRTTPHFSNWLIICHFHLLQYQSKDYFQVIKVSTTFINHQSLYDHRYLLQYVTSHLAITVPIVHFIK